MKPACQNAGHISRQAKWIIYRNLHTFSIHHDYCHRNDRLPTQYLYGSSGLGTCFKASLKYAVGSGFAVILQIRRHDIVILSGLINRHLVLRKRTFILPKHKFIAPKRLRSDQLC